MLYEGERNKPRALRKLGLRGCWGFMPKERIVSSTTDLILTSGLHTWSARTETLSLHTLASPPSYVLLLYTEEEGSIIYHGHFLTAAEIQSVEEFDSRVFKTLTLYNALGLCSLASQNGSLRDNCCCAQGRMFKVTLHRWKKNPHQWKIAFMHRTFIWLLTQIQIHRYRYGNSHLVLLKGTQFIQ